MTCYMVMERMEASLCEVMDSSWLWDIFQDVSGHEYNSLQSHTETRNFGNWEFSRKHDCWCRFITAVHLLSGLNVVEFQVVSALEFLCERQINTGSVSFQNISNPNVPVLAPKQILIGNDGKVKVAVSAAFPNGGVPPIRYSSVMVAS